MQEESVTVAIALLEKSQESTEKEMATLREAISEISKVNVRISELLAVHQVKIDQQQQKEEDINRKVETGITNLTLKMDNDRKAIYEKMDTDKTEVLTEVKSLRDRVFIGVGIVFTLNLIIVIAAPYILSSFDKGGLTNRESSARIQDR